MKDLKYSEIVSENRRIKKALSGTTLHIAILTNITVNLLKDVLEYQLVLDGIKSDVTVGDYDRANRLNHG